MKTLDEHNKERSYFYAQKLGAVANGIACPKCGNEMFDTDPNVTLTSNPPQKAIGCCCGYTGYRIA